MELEYGQTTRNGDHESGGLHRQQTRAMVGRLPKTSASPAHRRPALAVRNTRDPTGSRAHARFSSCATSKAKRELVSQDDLILDRCRRGRFAKELVQASQLRQLAGTLLNKLAVSSTAAEPSPRHHAPIADTPNSAITCSPVPPSAANSSAGATFARCPTRKAASDKPSTHCPVRPIVGSEDARPGPPSSVTAVQSAWVVPVMTSRSIDSVSLVRMSDLTTARGPPRYQLPRSTTSRQGWRRTSTVTPRRRGSVLLAQ